MSMNSEFGVMNLFYGGGTGLDATTRPAQAECFVSHIKTHKFFGALQMKNIYKLSGLLSDRCLNHERNEEECWTKTIFPSVNFISWPSH